MNRVLALITALPGLMGSMTAGEPVASGDAGHTAITSLAEVRKLSVGQSARALPVHVRGVITLYAPERYMCFLQQGTSAVYLDHVWELGLPLRAGQEVDLEGETSTGLFAPTVRPRQIKILREGQMPAPYRAKIGDLGTGSLDSRYVEVEGVLRSFHYETIINVGRELRLKLDTQAGFLPVVLSHSEGVSVGRLVGARVRVRGPVGVDVNKRRQLLSEYLAAESAENIEVVEPERGDPANSPAVPLAEVLTFRASNDWSSRVHVRGVVTYTGPNGAMVIQEGSHGMQLQSSVVLGKARVGALVDAVGFAGSGAYSPVLSDARVTVASQAGVPAPVTAEAGAAANGDYDLQLIRVKAELIAHEPERNRHTFWLRSGNITFSAAFDGEKGAEAFPEVPNGSKVELTGVCFTSVSTARRDPTGFSLALRSASDVRILKRPQWWSGERALETLGVAALLVFLILGWNMVLRRRVSAQTCIIERTAVFERERNAVLEMVGRNEPSDAVFMRIRMLIESQFPGTEAQICLAGDSLVPRKEACGQWSAPVTAASGELLATLAVTLSRPRSFSGGDQSMLESIARLTGLALEHRALYEQLRKKSQEDPLTGIANRALFEERLREAVEGAKRFQKSVACMFIDLDGFKQINDCYGHAAGDKVLKVSAARLKVFLRESDTLARVGGDEFCVVLPYRDRVGVESLAARLISSLEQPVSIDNETVRVSASLGISLFPDHDADTDGLQRRADAAMYRAKRLGKARFAVFDAELDLACPLKAA